MLLKHLALTVIGLASFGLADYADLGRVCGGKIAPCPEDMTCVRNADKLCSSIRNCYGTCQWKNKYPQCGGFTPEPHLCDDSSTCMDDPRNVGSCGMACDFPGICVPKKAPNCGGIAGFKCPDGLFCYDIPNDGCDPLKGGADCFGICI